MGIADYSAVRDLNAEIVPGNIISSQPENQQILNAIRQLMADLKAFQTAPIVGNARIGDGTDISPSNTPTGQLIIDGNGYDGYVALDAAGMHIGHNSALRNLTLDLNETTAMTLSLIAGFAIPQSASTVWAGSASQVILGPSASTAAAGEAYIRPDGWNDSTGQLHLTPTLAVFDQNLTVNGAELRLANSVPQITIQDTNSTGIATFGGLRILDSAGTREWFIGSASTGDSDFYILTDVGNIRLRAATNIALMGTTSSDFTIGKHDDLASLVLTGGTSESQGASLWLFGDADAGFANDYFLETAGTTRYHYDHSLAHHILTGTLRVTAHIEAVGTVIKGSAAQLIIGSLGPTGDAATLYFRPQGYSSATSQTTINSLGNMTVNGNVTSVADGFHTANKIAANPATAGASMTAGGQMIAAIDDVFFIGNRLSSDGSLMHLRQANITDGTISTAAGVVTYGTFFGSHWSQPLHESDLPGCVKGTIVDSTDELCWWDGEDEAGQPNLILPKFEISRTVGSEKVYGVIAWEDEDGDWFIGALGAFLIRIQAGQTVQIGDYIESAGDGCGQVQKKKGFFASTVAKVTSTKVAETYADGSYLVPCTLHCG